MGPLPLEPSSISRGPASWVGWPTVSQQAWPAMQRLLHDRLVLAGCAVNATWLAGGASNVVTGGPGCGPRKTFFWVVLRAFLRLVEPDSPPTKF